MGCLQFFWLQERPLALALTSLPKGETDVADGADEAVEAMVSVASPVRPSRVGPRGDQRQTRLFLRQAAHVGSRLDPSVCSSYFLWRSRQVRQPVLVRDFLGRSCKCKGMDCLGVVGAR